MKRIWTMELIMPSKAGKDSIGSYYRWGKSGKKYYYDPNNPISKKRAKAKADKQGKAIYASGGY